ncbi:MAG: signal peptidase I [Eubacterium sp. 38_16]|nr:MAG: signal peptidase I [Eubacterium sp. 38_16]
MNNYNFYDNEKPSKAKIVKEVLLWVFQIVITIAIAFVFVYFMGQKKKTDYRFGSPKRLDAVILELENGSTTHYSVKRVIGLPGETVKIENGKIYINNKELKGFSEEEILSAGLAAYDVALEDDEYFVMGDNCNNSEDSRVSNIGNIKRSQFVGKITGTIHKAKRQ